MQIKSLKVFCDIVRQRSFSRAAAENDISQSGASQLVHQLEDEVGAQLIDRSKRPFVLTPEGKTYYDGARELVERYFALEDKVRSLHNVVAGQLRVASIYSVGLHHMNRCMQAFLSRFPKANVRLEYLHPQQVYESIEDHSADLGLVSYPKPSRSINAIPWRDERMLLVCAPQHALAAQDIVDIDDLQGASLVGFDPGLTIRKEIDRVLHAHGIEVDTVMAFDNIETLKRAVEIDAGVALLPEPTVVREVASGTLTAVPIASEELVRPLGIIHRRGKELSPTAQRFIDLLMEHAHPEQLLPEAAAEHRSNGHAAGNGNGRGAKRKLSRNGHRSAQEAGAKETAS